MINVTFKLPNETTDGAYFDWQPASVHIIGKNNGVSFNMETDYNYDFEEQLLTVSVPDGFELNDWALNSASIGNIDTSREISDDGNVLKYTMLPKDDAIHSLTDVWDLSKAKLSHDPYNDGDVNNPPNDVKFRLNNIHQPDAYNIQLVLIDSYKWQFLPRQDPSGVVTPTDLAPVIYVDENKKVQVKHDATIVSNNGVLSVVGTSQQQGMVTLTSNLVEPQAFKFTVTNTSNQTLDRVAISVEAVNYTAYAKQIPEMELYGDVTSDGSIDLENSAFFLDHPVDNAGRGTSFYFSATGLPPNGTVSFGLQTSVQSGLIHLLSNVQVWRGDELVESMDGIHADTVMDSIYAVKVNIVKALGLFNTSTYLINSPGTASINYLDKSTTFDGTTNTTAYLREKRSKFPIHMTLDGDWEGNDVPSYIDLDINDKGDVVAVSDSPTTLVKYAEKGYVINASANYNVPTTGDSAFINKGVTSSDGVHDVVLSLYSGGDRDDDFNSGVASYTLSYTDENVVFDNSNSIDNEGGRLHFVPQFFTVAGVESYLIKRSDDNQSFTARPIMVDRSAPTQEALDSFRFVATKNDNGGYNLEFALVGDIIYDYQVTLGVVDKETGEEVPSTWELREAPSQTVVSTITGGTVYDIPNEVTAGYYSVEGGTYEFVLTSSLDGYTILDPTFTGFTLDFDADKSLNLAPWSAEYYFMDDEKSRNRDVTGRVRHNIRKVYVQKNTQ